MPTTKHPSGRGTSEQRPQQVRSSSSAVVRCAGCEHWYRQTGNWGFCESPQLLRRVRIEKQYDGAVFNLYAASFGCAFAKPRIVEMTDGYRRPDAPNPPQSERR